MKLFHMIGLYYTLPSASRGAAFLCYMFNWQSSLRVAEDQQRRCLLALKLFCSRESNSRPPSTTLSHNYKWLTSWGIYIHYFVIFVAAVKWFVIASVYFFSGWITLVRTACDKIFRSLQMLGNTMPPLQMTFSLAKWTQAALVSSS